MQETTTIIISSWSVWNIVLGFVTALGGGAVIIGAVVRFAAEKIAACLQAKYQNTLEKELESYKSELEKVHEVLKTELDTKQHISVKRFDAEFEIYQQSTGCFSAAVRDCATMIPAGFVYVPTDDEARLKLDEEHYDKALKSVVSAQDYLFSIAPFVQKELYDGYKEILSLLTCQVNAYQARFDVNDKRPQEEKQGFSSADYRRTGEINIKFEELNDKVREYLNNLDVIGE